MGYSDLNINDSTEFGNNWGSIQGNTLPGCSAIAPTFWV